MSKKAVGGTALGAAICRLIEAYQPEATRICTDTLAKELIPPIYHIMLQSASMRNFTVEKTEAVAAGIYGAQVCRTRCIDEAVSRHLAAGMKQLVILGAGLDSRAYRLPGMEKVSVFEVDLPYVQAAKKKRIIKTLGQLLPNATYLPIDFSSQDLAEVLAVSDFDAAVPAIFIWEGVMQYLLEEDVRRTLTFIGNAQQGSVLLFTYVLRSIIQRQSPAAERLMDTMQDQGSPWYFGLDPAKLDEYLKPFHLKVLSDCGAREYKEKYLKPIGRELTLPETEHTVEAVVV
jgi:methyltransferase (TIGR00027 family)